MKKFLHEFKEFAMRGNVIDLAVGVIIGGAFQKIVNSLVNDVITPFIGLFAKKDFSSWQFEIMGVPVKYGSFITEVINFIIMAFVIFVMVKALNKIADFNKVPDKEEETPKEKKCPYCCSVVDINAVKCPHCTSDIPENE